MFGLAVPATNRVICLICLFGTDIGAVPTIAFPINSQVPPAARASMPFTFTFSSSTFSSSSSMNYTLSNAPSWLNLDGLTRTLFGVPPMSAANTAPIIQITASDNSGSVEMNATLVISDHPAPVVVIPLEKQLNALGAYSPPSSILYHPSTPFEFSFNPGTFSPSNLNHYAVTSDNTPLPAWITFDGATLSFSGQTPNSSSLIQPPQTWGLQLIASDVLGFAGTAINFNFIVGNHEFRFMSGLFSINATIGTPIKFTGLSESLVLDGKKASISEIASIEASGPDWLIFDNTTFGLSGTPSTGATSYDFSVTVVDMYQDVANATIHILVSESIFVKPLGPFNVTIGNPFTFDLSSSFLNASTLIASIETAPPAMWLSFDSQKFILSGIVPSDIQPSTVQICLKVVSKSYGVSDAHNFTLIISSPIQISSPTEAIPSTTETARSIETSNTIPAEAIATNALSGGKITAIVITLVLVVSATLLLCFVCYRRRKHCERQRAALEKGDISRPITTSLGDEEQAGTRDRRVANSDRPTNTTIYSRQQPPTLKRHSRSMSSIRGEVSMYLRDSHSSGTRGRSYSENALSEFGSSWRYTQDSAYPRIPVAAVRNSAMRTTRNFSRKSSGPSTRESGPSGSSVGSTFNKETTQPSRSSIQETPDAAYESETIKKERLSWRRTPNYLGFLDMSQRLRGLDHGSHTATSPLIGAPNWYIEEFEPGTSGQTYESQNYSRGRDECSWLTIPGSTDVNELYRQSALNVLTESTELLNSPRRMTVRQVPKSPSQLSQVSFSREFSRVRSRRLVGSSPFFAGSSRTGSRCTSRKSAKSARERYLHSISPHTKGRAPINSTLHKSIIRDIGDSESSSLDPGATFSQDRPANPLGISYGSPGEVTRQLRDYVRKLRSYVSPSSRNSMQFSDRDSRFRSAESSPGSRHYERPGGQQEDHTFQYSHYGHTDGSNSPCSFDRDIYGMNGSPQLSEGIGTRAVMWPGVLLPAKGSSRLREANSPVEVIDRTCMPSSGRHAGSYGHGMVREKSLSASHFAGVSDGEADASFHEAFL